MVARGEHEAEGRAVEAHQEAKSAARVRPVTLTEAEAADVVDALDDAAELALHTGRSVLQREAEELHDVVRRAIKRSEEEAT